MRILITSNRGAGHIEPLVPFARALLRAGDDVLVAAPEGVRPHVERAGLPFFALADPPDDERDAAMAGFPRLTNDEQGVIMLRDVFADIYARASLPGVLAAIDRFAPDMILREPTEFAGLLAAERRGLPHGRIGIWRWRTTPGACRSSPRCSTPTAPASACPWTRAASGSSTAQC